MERLLFLVAFALAAGAAQAQVYKCVDSSGKTVYSQSPCARDSRTTTLERNARPAAAPAANAAAAAKGEAAKASGPKTAAELEQEFRKRRQEQEEAQKKEEQKLAEAKDREENCRSARMQLTGLESNPRQLRIDEKGERYFLDDAQVEREKDRARRAVDSWCK
jgi:hypothetical protein